MHLFAEAYFAIDPPNFESLGALLGVHQFKEVAVIADTIAGHCKHHH